ncbi:methyl-accepting chemotaxis protein [Paenibacillus sp. FSL P2-0136]|uniref:methyl-accepting chemotaxis protein n=1 Tax=Paenibacillus sp. FSL P2-0136 TaxID=2975317 RepID=UPI0030D92B92
MKRRRFINFSSVGVKLFVILFCTIVLLSSVLGLTSYYAAKGIITDEVAAASSQSIVQAADKLDFLFAEYEALSRQFAVDPALKADMETVNRPSAGTVARSAAEDRIRRKLDSVRGSDERLLGVRLVARSMVDAESYKSTGISGVRSDEGILARMKEIDNGKGNPVWFPVRAKGFFDAYSESAMTMGRLLRNIQNPAAEYYMLIEVKGQALTDVLSNLHIGLGGEIRILDSSGRVAYSADDALLGQASYIHTGALKDGALTGVQKGEEQKLPGAVKSEERELTGKRENEGQEPAGARQGESGKRSFTAGDEQGSAQLVVYQPLSTADWTLLGYAPVSDFTKSADRLLYITLLVVLAAALIALIIGYVLVRLIGRPLGKLARLMEEGEQGNLQVRTSFKGRDEIGRLGHGFNRMMEQISQLAGRSSNSAAEVLATAEQLVAASGAISGQASEVAAATGEIAGGAASLAAEAESSNAKVELMGGKTSEVAERNAVMAASAEKVMEVSDQGAERMKKLVSQSEDVLKLMDLIQENSAMLRDSTVLIRSILSPMIAMNKQTNILALNASIEAVRAGAAGRGFIVIANEIRGLANQSSESIASVSRITEEISSHIENTVKVVSEAAPMFHSQLASVRESSLIFGSVRAEMEVFSGVLNQSSAAVSELAEYQQQLGQSMASVISVVQQTSASTEEVASMSSQQFTVSRELVALSHRLEELAEQLKQSMISFQG